MQNGTTTSLFSQASTTFLSQDLQLTWGPDSQTVIASASHASKAVAQLGPYSATLANPAATQQYTPGAVGPVFWRSDSKAFALQNMDVLDTSMPSSVYVFMTEETQGRVLLNNAREFSWG